ncbi:hypothetical protein [uncultured Paraglaciecola sp.]|uniref:hypothetical protein n=1 Tax=uncultured Paraglaciecola sp. TaxID=1765024 RepID=UPI0030D72C55|tara:strand:- start:2313 stop:3371 length:1059 start_codon:yes stop_codon:yes gene_type:complete
MPLSGSQKDTILEAARFAPSADNSVPWQYSWKDNDVLCLYNDKTRSGAATDSTYILTNLAMGAATENIMLCAHTLGLSAATSYKKEGDEICVTISFEVFTTETRVESEVQLAEQIENRHSDRRFPYKGEITSEIIKQLTESINNTSHSLIIYNDKTSIKQIVPIIRRAEAVRFKSESLHAELFDTVKFDDNNPLEGMTLDVLGIEAPARPMFKLLKKWSAMKRLNLIGVSQLIAVRSVTLPIVNSPGLAMITTPSDSAIDIFNAGRQIQRVWLKATNLGLSVHLYAAPGVLTLAKPNLNQALSEELVEIETRLDKITSGTDKAVMFLRLGYKEGTPPRAGRREVKELEKQLS